MKTPEHLLLRGVRRQITNDRAPLATSLLRSVLDAYPAVRWLNRVLQAARATPLLTWVAVLNAGRCYMRCQMRGQPGGVLACARRANEIAAVEWFRTQTDRVPWCSASFAFDGFRATARSLPTGWLAHRRRWASLANRLRRTHDVFHVIRVLELLAYYERYGRELDRGGYRAVLTSSYSNPWGIAMNLAAHRRGIPVLHVMHGTAIDPVPQLQYDLVVFNDRGSQDVFARSGCQVRHALFKGIGQPDWTLRSGIPAGALAVGLFLSKQPSAPAVVRTIERLLLCDDVDLVVVRPHPANLWRGLAAALAHLDEARVAISAASASDDFARCAVALAGNSSVHLDALLAGVPSVFVAELDEMPTEEITLVRDELVLRAEEGGSVDRASIAAFYSRREWVQRFLQFTNAAQSADEVTLEIRGVVEGLLALAP